jgi:hypothetical protein
VKSNRDFADTRAAKNKSEASPSKTDSASAEGEGGNKVQVAGAVSITIDSTTARAKIGDGLTIQAGQASTKGVLTLKSENNSGAEAIADASTVMENAGKTKDGKSGTGIGVAVAINVANVVNEAVLGDSTIHADGVVIQALVPAVGKDGTHGFKAEATSGASGAGTGVAGALAVNVGISRAQAKVSGGATVTVHDGGNVDLKAENFVSNAVQAGALQKGGGKVGVGASIAVNVGETDTDAVIGTGADILSAKNITLVAASTSDMTTQADGGSAGDTAVTGVVAVSVADNDTQAVIEDGANPLVLAGTLDVAASHAGSLFTDAAGDTKSGKTGVGITIAVSVSTDSALATTSRDITADGAVQFGAEAVSVNRSTAKASVAGGESKSTKGADTSQSADQKAGKQEDMANQRSKSAGGETGTGGKKTDAAKSDTSSGSVSVAGAVAVTVATSTSRAWLPEFTTVTAGANGGTGALVLQSSNLTDSMATADGSAVTKADGTGVGIGIAVNVASVTNEAYIGAGSVIVADGLTVTATTAERDVEMTVSSQAVVDTTAETLYIGIGGDIKTGDKVTYKKGSGDAVGGLTDNSEYYARVEGAGKVTLYDTEDHALAGGTEGRVDLTGAGTGTGHKFKYGGLFGIAESESLVRCRHAPDGHTGRRGEPANRRCGGLRKW